MKELKEEKSDNEIIAEFMGLEKVRTVPVILSDGKGTKSQRPVYRIGFKELLPHQLRYDTSWDWLMPVVQKIRDLSVAVEISYSLGTICKICYNNGRNFEWLTIEDNDGISAVYKAVVEFIKFYNSQNQ